MRVLPALLSLAVAASISAGKAQSEASEAAPLPPKPVTEIRGRVVDTEGEPVSGVTIMVLRSTVTQGRRESVISKMATTNDKGEYRVAQLPSGRYLVKAAGFHGTSIYLGDDPPMPNTHETFEPVYFPRARTEDAAAAIALDAGAEAYADFSLELKPGHRLRGRITNLVPYQPVAVQLLVGREDVALTRSSINQENGRFEISGVLDGAYRLRAVQFHPKEEMSFAERSVEVAGKDLDGLELTLSPGQVIKGTVRLDSAEQEKLEDYGGAEVTLVLVDGLKFESGPACVLRSRETGPGAFEVRSLIPGTYRVMLQPYGPVYLKSAKAGDADLLANNELAVGTDAPPQIEVVLAVDGGIVSGTIAAESAETFVLLVPESLARPPLAETADDGGSFSFHDVPPGAYRLHAWRESAEVEYVAPRILRLLVRTGVRVEVKSGSEVTVQLPALSEAPR